MSIPCNLSPLGVVGTGVLPVGYMAAEFLESTGTQYINIPFSASSDGHAVIIETVHFTTGSAQIQAEGCNFMAYGVYNNASFYAQTGNGFASGGYVANEWNAHKTKWENKEVTIFKPDGSLASAERGLTTVSTLYLWRMYAYSTVWTGKKKYWKSSIDGVTQYDMICGLDSEGKPCMFDKVTRKPFYNAGTGQFVVGMTMKQARKLGKLTAGGGTLTVSLPWEAGVDAKVQEALATAAENGWTVMVQYREPEAATENIAVDFLETTGTQYIATDIKNNTSLSVEVECSILVGNASYPNMGFVCGCAVVNGAGFQMPLVKEGFTSGGYRARCGYNELISYIWHAPFSEKVKAKNSLDGYFINRKKVYEWKNKTEWETTSFIYLFTDVPSSLLTARRARWFAVEMSNSEAKRSFIPTLDPQGTPCMFDEVTKQPFYNSGSGAFIAGFESTEKAALGLAKLPVVDVGELTVSLPAAAQDEATRVPAAIEVARQRGWTIITQYRED